jgi:tetratricopeptide (TPR) repeat protein
MGDTDADNEAVDMRANRSKYHKKRAKKLMAKAEKSLHAKLIMNGFFLKFETAAFQYYQAALSFRACSIWRDAGYCLVRCATMHHFRLRNIFEAALLYSEAAEVYEKIDKGESMKNYKLAISLYCDLGRFDIAGKIQKKIAISHLRLKHYEEAAEGFRKASDFLSNQTDQSDYCLEKAAECLIELNEYQAASELYTIIAESYAQSNLKYFNCRDKLFRSIMCLFAEPMVPEDVDEDGDNNAVDDGGSEQKYANIKAVVAAHEHVDILWRCSKEVKFINNIIDCREEYNQHEFADHLYYYHTAKSLQRLDLKMLSVVADEIQDELDRRREKIRLDRLEATRYERRKARLAKKRKALTERGLDPESIQLADINVDDDSEEEDNGAGEKGGGGEGAGEGHGSGSESEGGGSDSDSDSESGDSSGGEDIALPEDMREVDAPVKQRRRRGEKKEEVDDAPAYLR